MSFTRCWNCTQAATNVMTRQGSQTLHACDNCTRIDRTEAESRGWTVTALADPEPVHFTAWLTVDPAMILGANCDILILEDEQSGDDWTTKQGTDELFKAETTVPAEIRGDHTAAQSEAEDLMEAAGWRTVGDWESVDSGYVATVERA